MLVTGFLKDESAATTVEWVVLTAAVVAIFGAVIVVISSGIFSTSDNISTDAEIGGIASEKTRIDDSPQITITAEDLQIAPIEPDLFTSWEAANMWIDACIKTGGVPEVSADSDTNIDGSPTKIRCI